MGMRKARGREYGAKSHAHLKFFISAAGPLPPSRCRSLFTLATAMIIFSAKAYEIHSLVSCAKATLNNKLFDPFLCLVGDSKLQAVNKNASIKFGSKEDDNSASRYLSEIIITEDQTRESFASEILKSLEKMKDAEMCTVKEQLLSEFLPDDVCPLGAQMFENPSKIYKLDSRQSVCQDETIPFFNIDDDSMTDNKPKPELLLMAENATFLSVNQLLESQKMSNLMTAQRQDYLISLCVENDELEQKRPAPQSLAGNPFLDENLVIPICKTLPPFSPLLMLCATEYQQQPHYFKLPTSCPYDNFLKAAGC